MRTGRATRGKSGTSGITRGRYHTAARRRIRVAIEALEGRALMAGNLKITSAQLADIQGNPIASVVTGEQVWLRADWTSSGLAADRYSVHFVVDGVPLDSATIKRPGGAGPRLLYGTEIVSASRWRFSPGSARMAAETHEPGDDRWTPRLNPMSSWSSSPRDGRARGPGHG